MPVPHRESSIEIVAGPKEGLDAGGFLPRATRDTLEFHARFRFWIVEAVVGPIATVLVADAIFNQPSDALKAVCGVVSVLALFGVVFLCFAVVAPFRQRNEARKRVIELSSHSGIIINPKAGIRIRTVHFDRDGQDIMNPGLAAGQTNFCELAIPSLQVKNLNRTGAAQLGFELILPLSEEWEGQSELRLTQDDVQIGPSEIYDRDEESKCEPIGRDPIRVEAMTARMHRIRFCRLLKGKPEFAGLLRQDGIRLVVTDELKEQARPIAIPLSLGDQQG